MAEYLNVSSIKSAAELLNSTLVAKGFVTEELLFPTINWEQLTLDQPETEKLANLSVKPILYNNDKNVINLLYSLTQSLDRYTLQHRQLRDTIDQRDKSLEQMKQKITHLETLVQTSEYKLNRKVHVDQVTLEARSKRLARENRAQLYEITRLKSWNSDLQAKFDVELRKKSFEISLLKDKLLDTRNLSTTITYGKPFHGIREPAGGAPNVNTNLIYDNKPIIISETQLELSPDRSLEGVLQEEKENVAAQLSELVESLVRENGKFVLFCRELTKYFSTLNNDLADLAVKNIFSNSLPDPLKIMDMSKVSEGVVSEVDPFETVTAPLLARMYENYENILTIVSILENPLSKPKSALFDEDRDELDRLRTENINLRDNLKEAMRTLDDWKDYKLNRQK